ncbi:MAG: hypothetical protein ACREPQ_08135 [Rhodanobacter sp.]
MTLPTECAQATGDVSFPPEPAMSTTHATTLTALLTLALGSMLVVPSVSIAHADAGRRPQRHFDLVNATFDSVTALAIAPADSDAFHDIPLGQPLQGGLTAMTFDVPAGGCMRDIRVTFHGERTKLFPHIDVCRSTGLRLTPHGDRSKPSSK